jgi:hypothetical protein
MNVELFWTGTSLILVWQVVSFAIRKIGEEIALRQLGISSWDEEFEVDFAPDSKMTKKK